MPIPFILGIAAIGAAAAGIKKGIDAKGNFANAKLYAESAEQKYRQEKQKFDRVENALKERIERYGKLKVKTYIGVLEKQFLPVYKKFEKSINLSELPPDQRLSASDVRAMTANIDIANKIASGAAEGMLKGAASGIGAAAGAWALAGSVGVASTGTAISTLGGAAAYNAAMAWLGGGALSAGGLGMAGGTMLLGGLVAGPVIAITGFVMAAKSEKALTEAMAYSDRIDVACAEMNRLTVGFRAKQQRCDELTVLVQEFAKRLLAKIETLKAIARSKKGLFHRQKMNENDQKDVQISFIYAKALKDLLDTPVIDERGELDRGTQNLLVQSQNLLRYE